MKHVDMVVIGSGPAGQKAAIQAAKLGKQVVLIERAAVPGGACINTGTIPSKALREAVYHLTGLGQRRLYGDSYTVKQDVTIDDLIYRSQQVVRTEIEVIRGHMARNGVELLDGSACFVDDHTIHIRRAHNHETVEADFVVVAVGTSPARPKTVPFDNERIVDTDSLLRLQRLPKSMIVVGGGVIGVEYA